MSLTYTPLRGVWLARSVATTGKAVVALAHKAQESYFSERAGVKPIAMAKKPSTKQPVRWVTVWQVWHVRGKRYIRRHDGQPFRFPMYK